MKLVSVYDEPSAAEVLYELLSERPRCAWISHKAMPTFEQHVAFVESQPFFRWYLIENAGDYVGAIEVTDRNEIGVSILDRYKRRGFAQRALKNFMSTHMPLPAIPAIRNPRWLVNIAAENEAGKDFFSRMGFEPLQETWCL